MIQLNENASEQNCTPEDGKTRQTTQAGTSLEPDQVAYMADMIGELNKLARERGMETLAGLLALAQVEARRNLNESNATFKNLTSIPCGAE
jgi:hypothetical protein